MNSRGRNNKINNRITYKYRKNNNPYYKNFNSNYRRNMLNKIPQRQTIIRTRRNINNRNAIRRYNNNQNKNRNNIENELKKVNNKLKDMTIKTTNLIVSKKELRTDRLVSPYTMARRGQYIPIYEIKEKVLNMSVYTKISITLNATTDNIKYTLVFFPYSINFKNELYNYYTNPVMVQGGACNHYKNVFFLEDNLTTQTFTVAYHETADSGIIGNWKLIGSSMKIYNTSSMINKGGDFSIIKIQDNELHPIFTHNDNAMNVQTSIWVKNQVNKDFNQAPRNNFSASDTAFIDEYNVSNGTNIFSAPAEYLGCKYTTPEQQSTIADFNMDMMGNNVAYLFQTKSIGTAQNYIFEIWNVFSIIPCPSSGLGNLGAINSKCFNKKIVDSIKDRPNMYKANK